MAKDPRFNFYVDNYKGGTRRFTFEQKGAYIDLLLVNFYAFQDQLPGFTEDEALNELANPTAKATVNATALWEVLKPKFVKDGVYYYNERLKKEFFKSKKSSDLQSKRAKSRWDDSKPADAVADACNGISNGNEIKNPIENEIVFPFDSENFKIAWGNFLEFKKVEFNERYKSPKTEQAALHGLKNKANDDESTAIAIINQSIENRWRGLFPLKTQSNGKFTGTKQESSDRIKKFGSMYEAKKHG